MLRKIDTGKKNCVLNFACFASLAPGAPENVYVEGVGSFALNVTWEPPTDDGGSPIFAYIITVNETSREVEPTVYNVLIISTEIFMPSTTYEYVIVWDKLASIL